MSRSKQSFNKRQKEVARIQRREKKAAKKKERRTNAPGGGLENMMAWVDENGRITNVPQPLVREPDRNDPAPSNE